MEKEINCVNFRGLLEYLRKHYGEEGIKTVTDQLVGNPEYLVSDKKDPTRQAPVSLEYLMDSSNWVSNEFSLRILGNVNKIIQSPSPLFTAGEGTALENFSTYIFFLARLLGPQRVARSVARINAYFNKTKTVEVVELTSHSAVFQLTYLPNQRVTRDVCEWNRGLYSGIARVAGAVDVQTREKTCRVNGDPHCTIEVTWKRVGRLKQIYRWILKAGLEDLLADYEKALKDREQLIDNLTESEQRYRSLTDHSLTGIFIYQGERFVYVNEMLARLSGYTAQEFMGLSVGELIHDDYQEAIRSLADLIQEGPSTTARREFQGRRKDGSSLWLEILVSVISFQGSPALMGNVIDITDRKRMEEERIVLSKLESTGLLAGGIAHDFNNLLSVILGNVEMVTMFEPDPGDLHTLLAQIKTAVLEARDLTYRLITLAEGGDPIKKRLSLSELIRDQVAFALRGASVVSNFSIPVNLWRVEADADQIGQVIRNIVLNAREAMEEGGAISISAVNEALISYTNPPIPPGDYVKISITDQGGGISQAILSRIFDPYFSTKQRGERKGMGLGLTISRSIVQKHGGVIIVDTKINQGTTFNIYLPASREAVSDKPAPEEIPSRKGRILVMDDEEAILKMTGAILSRLGYEVELAENGEKAVSLYRTEQDLGHPFDAVILDLTIRGGMGGQETLRQLFMIDPLVKAIVSSGYSQDPLIQDFTHYGFKGALTKPFLTKELSQLLSEVIDLKA